MEEPKTGLDSNYWSQKVLLAFRQPNRLRRSKILVWIRHKRTRQLSKTFCALCQGVPDRYLLVSKIGREKPDFVCTGGKDFIQTVVKIWTAGVVRFNCSDEVISDCPQVPVASIKFSTWPWTPLYTYNCPFLAATTGLNWPQRNIRQSLQKKILYIDFHHTKAH